MNSDNVKYTVMDGHLPYSVPQGYFEGLKTRLSEIPGQNPVSVDKVRFAPYMALAAVFVFALILGNVFVRRDNPSTVGASEDEIIEYLIDSGVSLAQLEETVNY